jgi:hypothetical protein
MSLVVHSGAAVESVSCGVRLIPRSGLLELLAAAGGVTVVSVAELS